MKPLSLCREEEIKVAQMPPLTHFQFLPFAKSGRKNPTSNPGLNIAYCMSLDPGRMTLTTFLHIRLGFLPFSPVLENHALNGVMSFAIMNEVVNSYATVKKIVLC